MGQRGLVVMKFGGTSVQDAAAIRRLLEVVAVEPRQKVVVVSALAGVTDALASIASGADADAGLDRLMARHLSLAREVVAAERQFAVARRVRELFAEAGAIATQRAWTPARVDALLAVGELASSAIVAEALAAAGLAVSWIDARDVVGTDDSHGAAKPDAIAIRAAARAGLLPCVRAGAVPILAGFIGRSTEGATTTLGRGGSDYSAALLAEALDASELEIWTDVDGVLTADPRLVEGAVPVPRLSFSEAYELARFGAKVLHWGTLEPVARSGIPVRVLNSREPRRSGTVIEAQPEETAPAVSALAHLVGVTVADVLPRGVTGCRSFLQTAAEWLDRDGHRAMVLSLTPRRAVVCAREADLAQRFVEACGDALQARVTREAALVTLVGHRVSGHPGAWHALSRELAAGHIESVIPCQSGDALVAVTTAPRVETLAARLHDELLGRCDRAAHQIAGGVL